MVAVAPLHALTHLDMSALEALANGDRPPHVTNEVILAWVSQLLSAEVVSLVEGREGQIEIRLFANRGKVRKNPMILLNAGPQEMV